MKVAGILLVFVIQYRRRSLDAVLAFVLTQNTTHRVRGLRGRIEEARFGLVHVDYYLAGTLQLLVAERIET